MKKIILLFAILCCAAGVRANQYSINFPYPYVEKIVSPSPGSYTYVEPKGGTVSLSYTYPQTTYAAAEFKARLNSLIDELGIAAWLSVVSVSLNTSARTGTISFYLAANHSGITRSIRLTAGATETTCIQNAATSHISPSYTQVIPGENISLTINGSQSGEQYELYCDDKLVSTMTGTGAALNFTHQIPLIEVGKTSCKYSFLSSTGENDACYVYYFDAIVQKKIIADQLIRPIDQSGGRVIVKCAYLDNSVSGELATIVNRLNTVVSSYWNKNNVTISPLHYNEDYTCDLCFDFSPNIQNHSFCHRPFLLFTSDGAEVNFEQEGIDPQLALHNWIRTNTYITEGGCQWVSDIAYYDGLGRDEQTIQKWASPSAKDIVAIKEYDDFGRENRLWLPVPVEYGHGVRQNPQMIHAMAMQCYADDYPYLESVYEPSPLNRINGSWNAGAVMRANSAKATTEYSSNDNDNVLIACVRDNDSLEIVSRCPIAGSLSKQIAMDADGRITHTYSNTQGDVVLSRIFSGIDTLDTYYFYDRQGRLRWMISPEGAARLKSVDVCCESDDLVRLYGYVYHYDARNRICEKRLPGNNPEYFVYDQADRVVAYQDGNLQKQGLWSISTYDPMGRLRCEGLVSSTQTREQLSSYCAGQGNLEALREDVSFRLQRQCWYDFNPPITAVALRFSRPDTDWVDADSRTKGLLMYEKIAVLGTDTGAYIERAYYYDRKGREIQRVEHNCFGGVSRYCTRYDFQGNILEQRESHDIPGTSAGESLRTVYTYDNRGRKLSETSMVGNAQAKAIYCYDELGRLSSVSYGTGGDAISEHYAYNVQGWLTQRHSPCFAMHLHYYDPEHAESLGRFSGDISEWTWRQGDMVDSNTYAFSYDDLSRLVNTKQYINGQENNLFVEQGLSYDRNGNIRTLKRYENGTVKNDYSFTYIGNHLQQVDDQSNVSGLISMPSITQDGIYGGPIYAYDEVGNTVYDAHAGINIRYNHLNLIEKVTNRNTIQAKYSYLSNGLKLSATNTAGDGLYYLGSFVYVRRNGVLSLESAGFGNGRFVGAVDGIRPYYFLSDHLGSVRVVIGTDGEIVERNDYYPFGLRWNSPDLQITDNRYHYNGKEDQECVGAPYSDYGARMYDPNLARWHSSDALAEKSPAISPYAFCVNNPIRFVDLKGLKIDSLSQDEWNSRKREIEKRKAELAEKNRKGKNDNRIAHLNRTLSHMSAAEESEEVYTLRGSAKSVSYLTYDPRSGKMVVGYRGTDMFVHEMEHVGQYENGELGFFMEGKTVIAISSIQNEVDAYQAQNAYSPFVANTSVINSVWVQNLTDNQGQNLYGPQGITNTYQNYVSGDSQYWNIRLNKAPLIGGVRSVTIGDHLLDLQRINTIMGFKYKRN